MPMFWNCVGVFGSTPEFNLNPNKVVYKNLDGTTTKDDLFRNLYCSLYAVNVAKSFPFNFDTAIGESDILRDTHRIHSVKRILGSRCCI